MNDVDVVFNGEFATDFVAGSYYVGATIVTTADFVLFLWIEMHSFYLALPFSNTAADFVSNVTLQKPCEVFYFYDHF